MLRKRNIGNSSYRQRYINLAKYQHRIVAAYHETSSPLPSIEAPMKRRLAASRRRGNNRPELANIKRNRGHLRPNTRGNMAA